MRVVRLMLDLVKLELGAIEKYIRSEGGRGVPKKAYEIVRRGRVALQRTYVRTLK